VQHIGEIGRQERFIESFERLERCESLDALFIFRLCSVRFSSIALLVYLRYSRVIVNFNSAIQRARIANGVIDRDVIIDNLKSLSLSFPDLLNSLFRFDPLVVRPLLVSSI